MSETQDAGPDPAEPVRLDSTATLLTHARAGDARARERLFARFLPVLSHWAHCRLPRSARDLAETDDLVQVTLMRALRRLDDFENRGEGAFLAYLREILVNAMRDEVRRAARRKAPVSLDTDLPDPGPSAIELAVGRETLARYEAGLARLTTDQRQAVVLKVEMGYSHAEIAEAMNKPSADAARMLLARALTTLAERMREQS